MKRKMLSTAMLMCVFFTACGSKAEDTYDTDMADSEIADLQEEEVENTKEINDVMVSVDKEVSEQEEGSRINGFEGETPQTRAGRHTQEVDELLRRGYELFSEQDYQDIYYELCNIDTGLDMEWVASELKSDRVIYIPEGPGQYGTGIGCGIYSDMRYFYFGDYVDGVRSGHGISLKPLYKDGVLIYDGEWKDDMPNGYGVSAKIYFAGSIYANKSTYCSGNFINGVQDGDFIAELKDVNGNTLQTAEYTVVNGNPLEAEEKLEQMEKEYNNLMAAGDPIDNNLSALHYRYEEIRDLNFMTIFVVFDDYNYMEHLYRDGYIGVYGGIDDICYPNEYWD